MRAAKPTSEVRPGVAARDRVTIDLRGMGPRLQAQAAVRRMTAAALVRSAVVAVLDDEPGDRDDTTDSGKTSSRHVVKVTLRLSPAHAVALASRARAADVSQGGYVAGLMDGAQPGPLPPDHASAIAALTASTDRLAVMSSDLNAFMRLLGRGSSAEIERYRAGIMSLADDVRGHLASAATLIAELRSARRPQ